MRYEVRELLLSEDHPLWPGEVVYKIYDKKLLQLSFGCYTKSEIAQKIVDVKNGT